MKYQIVFVVSLACVLLATVSEAVPTKVCEPGSIFMKDCNQCKCSTDGTDMACTRKMCEGSQDGAAPVPENEKKENFEETCVPGETFKKDCNDCTCPPSGIKSAGACTLLACIDSDFKKE